MRKLLLIATLAFTTALFAQTFGKQNLSPSDRGVQPYQQQLDRSVDQSIRLNQTISPFRNQYLAIQNVNPLTESPSAMAANEAPGSMAAGEGQASFDWYSQMVQSEARFNARKLSATRSASGFEQGNVQAE